jgi:cell filamentation protein
VTPDDRYDTSGLPEAQFEPGSKNQVLRNRIGITSKQGMNDAEARALQKTLDVLVRQFDETHRFTALDLCDCHRIWLGDIYDWAGDYRQVNVSKGDFLFAAAAHIPSLMTQFEREVLGRWTPCRFPTRPEILQALAETHVELVLIHPFRDGNGRLTRLLSTLMALQAGLPLLDFRMLTGEQKKEYFTAIQAGLDKRYAPMETLFEEIIEQSLSAS